MLFDLDRQKIFIALGASVSLWLAKLWLLRRHRQQKLLHAIRQRRDLVEQQISGLKKIVTRNASDDAKAKRLEITSMPFGKLQSRLEIKQRRGYALNIRRPSIESAKVV